MEFTRSHVAQHLVHLDGKPLSLKDYPFFPAIYDTGRREIVLKTGRQVTKSTTLASIMITDSVIINHFKNLYLSPSRGQTLIFSNTRLTKMLHHSPLIRKQFIDPKLTNNVLLQILTNGSQCALSYADDDPDRVRGNSADRLLVDEVQDIVYDAVVPVVKECMSNSDYGLVIQAGTPKSVENAIEHLWLQSTQTEWIMKCEGCSKWQFVDSVKSIGKHGVVCVSCGKSLNPRNGKWYSFNPTAKVHGFHIAQPIMPRNNEIPARWERILEKLETYSSSQFKNDVLGISDAIGTRYISQEELHALCEDYFIEYPPNPKVMEGIRMTSGGVDWSGGGELLKSRTVAWVWGLTKDYKLKVLYHRIFKTENPVESVEEVAKIFDIFNCRFVVGDAGEGHLANAHLRDRLGAHRFGAAQYGGGEGFGKLIQYSQGARKYLVNRTAAIDSFMRLLKERGVIYATLRQMLEPIQDTLNEYEELIKTSGGAVRKIWQHAPTNPDDALHAQIFAWLAMKVVQGDLEMYEQFETET